MTGDLTDPYYLDALFDGLDARDDVPRAHRIYVNWWRNRTGACLDDGQADLAEHLATLIDLHLPPDHRSIADVRAIVAEHVDLADYLHVSPETVGRVIEQVTIAADNVVAGERPIEGDDRVLTSADYWLAELTDEDREILNSRLHRLADKLDNRWFALAFVMLVTPCATVVVLALMAIYDMI